MNYCDLLLYLLQTPNKSSQFGDTFLRGQASCIPTPSSNLLSPKNILALFCNRSQNVEIQLLWWKEMYCPTPREATRQRPEPGTPFFAGMPEERVAAGQGPHGQPGPVN